MSLLCLYCSFLHRVVIQANDTELLVCTYTAICCLTYVIERGVYTEIFLFFARKQLHRLTVLFPDMPVLLLIRELDYTQLVSYITRSQLASQLQLNQLSKVANYRQLAIVLPYLVCLVLSIAKWAVRMYVARSHIASQMQLDQFEPPSQLASYYLRTHNMCSQLREAGAGTSAGRGS